MTRYNLKISIILLILLTACATVEAQQRICTSYVPFSGYPDSLFVDLKNMEAGQAYVKCLIPNEYETFADSNFIVRKSNIITKNQEIIAVKPIIEEVTDSIVLKKKYSKWVINTAIKPPKGMRILAPIYKDSLIRIIVEKERTKWTKVKGDANCMSQNPNECLVFYLMEVPAQYNALHNLKQIQPPRKIVAEDTIALNATELARYGAVETQYTQVTYYHQVLKQAGLIEFSTPNKTRYISPTQKLVRLGGTTKWSKVTCCHLGERINITFVQKTLKARGYYKGKIDGILGVKTKTALVKFQKDNGLSTESLNFETLWILEIGYK